MSEPTEAPKPAEVAAPAAAAAPAPNAGNKIDAVVKKKLTFTLTVWELAVILVVANVIGAILHV